MSRRIGADLGFIAWQKPVTVKELVKVMFARGLSQQECVDRLQHRGKPTTIEARWREAYANRPDRPAKAWRPRTISSAEIRA